MANCSIASVRMQPGKRGFFGRWRPPYLVALKGRLMEVCRQDGLRDLLQTVCGCSADQCHGRQAFYESCSFELRVCHGVLADLRNEADWLHGRACFEENHCIDVTYIARKSRGADLPHCTSSFTGVNSCLVVGCRISDISA